MTDHQSLVTSQFGARAAAYVTSAVHAQGADLGDIAEAVAAVSHAHVLDLGCGGGHASFAAAPQAGAVVATDLSAEMVAAVATEAARRGLTNITTRQSAVEALPFLDKSFDVVMSRLSAHHWTDAAAGLREARRVLKPGGVAIFIDVLGADDARADLWFQAIELLRDPSHVRDYTLAEWRRMLGAAGFTPGEVRAHTIHLDFQVWVDRMNTPEVHRQAIRSMPALMPADVAAYLKQEADGSFTINTATMFARG